MTEDEARGKWCPFVRVIEIRTGPERYERLDSRGNLNESGGPSCIASDCMMWRWVVSPSDAAREAKDPFIEVVSEVSGYCGLAK